MSKTGNDNGRRGVAIVIVVGMLAVLMLMAVAFSISMRIERKGAGAYRFNAQAQHMLRAALTEAMHAIDQNMDSATNFNVYPPWQARESFRDDATKDLAQVLTAEAMDHVPLSLDTEAWQTEPRFGQFTVEKTISGTNETIVRGRYAFVAMNASGLLDGNAAGGTNRLYGADPAEMQVANITRDLRNAGTFVSDRQMHLRYETLPEMKNLNGGLESHYASALRPYDFGVYSRADEGQYLSADGTGSNKVSLAGTVSDLEQANRRAEIIAALIRSGTDPAEADFVFDNLLDYLDTNSVPRNLAAGYTEAVPMVSEFQADYSASAVAESAPAVVNLTQLKVEMHYPFTRPSPYTFSLYTEWMATLQNKGSGQKMSVTGAVRRLPDCGYAPNVDVKKYFTKQGAGTPFSVQVDATNGQTLALSIGVRAWVAIADPAGGTNDTEVDSAPYPRNAFIMIPAIEFPAGPAVPVTSVGMECCDPRFNWDATDANFWRQSPSGGTLSRTNLYTRQYLANERGVDRGTDMYVSDAGRLQMVGELGALLASGHVRDRFKTIRLFERDQYAKMSGVLKYSCMTNSGTTTNALLRRGLVNMNTENTNALAAAFCGAPVEFGQTNSVVSWTDARLIAERMIRAGEFWDVSDIGSLTPPAGQGSKANINWTTEFPDLTDLQREAIISYSAGLLTVRQNLFLIALATDAFSMRVGGAKSGKGAVLASAYALATVWRDPFRDANGNHHWAIRDFRVLSY